ncbi:hypothetical protein GO755_34935 [Spirosoma sp. HMF4905]|uniref:DUF4355 domain-containing protein n=1 Tax=Spirosoma arboris TaxID=2682092 RepID=A0A7K1SN92_9BACT|nr:hypothetical protein [Spirosoma arboris]MVM35270.1 hypothetical protein [Spirosoma arboris]
MTDKEIARFKVKFPKLNLSKARLASIKLKVDDEADDDAIDLKLDEANEMFPFADIQKNDDRIATDASKEKEKQQKENSAGSDNDKTKDSAQDDMPGWFKSYIEKNDKRLEAIEQGKTLDTRKSQLEAKLKDATDAFKNTTLKAFNRMQFKDDEEFNSYLEEVETDAAEFVQTEANASLGQTKPPVKSSGNTPKTASKEEVQAIFGKPK